MSNTQSKTESTKRLILVTLQGGDPFIRKEDEGKWMTDNHCARMGDTSFLFYDDITTEQAAQKFIPFISNTERASAFLASFPFIYQGTKIAEDGLSRVFGEQPSTHPN